METIKVSLAEKEAIVHFDSDKISAEKVTEEIYDMGFDAYLKSVDGKSVAKNGEICCQIVFYLEF